MCNTLPENRLPWGVATKFSGLLIIVVLPVLHLNHQSLDALLGNEQLNCVINELNSNGKSSAFHEQTCSLVVQPLCCSMVPGVFETDRFLQVRVNDILLNIC